MDHMDDLDDVLKAMKAITGKVARSIPAYANRGSMKSVTALHATRAAEGSCQMELLCMPLYVLLTQLNRKEFEHYMKEQMPSAVWKRASLDFLFQQV